MKDTSEKYTADKNMVLVKGVFRYQVSIMLKGTSCDSVGWFISLLAFPVSHTLFLLIDEYFINTKPQKHLHYFLLLYKRTNKPPKDSWSWQSLRLRLTSYEHPFPWWTGFKFEKWPASTLALQTQASNSLEMATEAQPWDRIQMCVYRWIYRCGQKDLTDRVHKQASCTELVKSREARTCLPILELWLYLHV